MPRYDLILVGAGLANGLIALRLRQQRPSLRILLIDAESQPGAHHTWSFHADDLTEAQHRWIAPLVVHHWPGYEVRFPQRQRHLNSGYFCVTAERFAQVMRDHFAADLLLNTRVATLDSHSVTLDDGRVVEADAVIDGRGYQPDGALRMGFQSFVGQEWQLGAPHGLTAPIIMDATVDQQAGYRFVYSLPFSTDTLLIEDTHYIDRATLDGERARQNIRDYAAQQGWQLARLLREEQGALPITLTGDVDAFWQKRDLPCSGLRAGLFHPTTGYSLPLAVALADRLAEMPVMTSASLNATIRQVASQAWQQQRFFRMLNRMLFLAGPAGQRWLVMQRFYGLPEGLIARFYAGKLTLPDRLRILSGKPPVPVLAALQAIMTPHRQQAMQ
ncbi:MULTISPECIES: lycopene beta-cyclase CrtY [unclassified Pantoea]|uniref:lycopene beta-cyclase CrtY n=1 Tax=unclassified Pantoea TaxID=2630326 RepID=UPI001231B56C|nr:MULTISPECIES: lycopene beta-cyclase CrtY [unclassified Pantoea]KAA5974152.1 lycopene beta-cyclase CrtY [Pantoea sp. M_6]KAA5978156.1 lycopene beta-cyclase CrtY [Pantoea sp. M_8]KAA5990090.1 lycopene beta-cyclase CrtY [Pantoea sp. M_10]KAA6000023.1 lycopene beta-cyclase CrtY [Pantoea sp. M_5]